jgi:ammonia channel protein AmtB
MKSFSEQVGLPFLFSDLLYVIAGLAVLLIIAGLGLVDMSLVRRKNVLDTWVQKIAAASIAGFATILGGYAIWQWQFNVAFAVPHPLWQAIKDWWIGGQYMTTFAGNINPKALPEADVLQVFVMFFATFSMATMALIHAGTIERMRPMPLYVMSFVIGLVLSPAAGLLGWGPVGPLTNHGTHDFEGVFPLYIFAGTWVAVLAWRLGPRLGAFESDARGVKPAGHNQGLAGLGVMLILFAIPLVVLGSTFIIPDVGVFGISFTNTGIGILIINTLAAICVGGTVGAVIAYRRRQAVWVLLGPIAGVVFCGTMIDVAKPWHIVLLAGFGPLVALGTAKLLVRLRIDEPKVVPLALGPGITGAIVCGFVFWGTKTGGYPGLKGDYALQHAEITPWWQLAGVVAIVALAAIPCLLFCLFYERRGKLRVTEEEEIAGLDQTYWGVSNFGTEPREDLAEAGNGKDQPAARIAAPAP